MNVRNAAFLVRSPNSGANASKQAVMYCLAPRVLPWPWVFSFLLCVRGNSFTALPRWICFVNLCFSACIAYSFFIILPQPSHVFYAWYLCRAGQNHIHTVYIRYFWQGNHQLYRCCYDPYMCHMLAFLAVQCNKHVHIRSLYVHYTRTAVYTCKHTLPVRADTP